LRRLMRDVQSEQPTDRLDVSEVGQRYLAHLKALGRKRSTQSRWRSAYGSSRTSEAGRSRASGPRTLRT
jgi:hypothetical protein